MEKVQKTLNIGGMHCTHCQDTITEGLSGLPGVSEVHVSYADGTASFEYDKDTVSLKAILDKVTELGYEVLDKNARAKPDYVQLVSLTVIILGLYVLLQKLGLLNVLAPDQLADSQMGFEMLFVVGLMTSVHCIAMCGGINLSQSLPTEVETDSSLKPDRLQTLRPSALYNGGRVLSYTIIGTLLGTVGWLFGAGASTGMSLLIQGVIKGVAGIFMVIMGLNMLNLFPWLRKLTLRIPWLGSLQRKRKGRGPFYIGCLNGIMPCGPLQAMWLVALASGNPISGGLSMLLFSLGTVPLMMGFGSLVAALGRKFSKAVLSIGAVFVVVLGFAMLSQGGLLSGMVSESMLLALVTAFLVSSILLSIPAKTMMDRLSIGVLAILVFVIAIGGLRTFNQRQIANRDTFEPEIVNGVQIVRTTMDPGAYPDIVVKAGIPVKWIIDAPKGTLNGCNHKMLIPQYDLEVTLHRGENVIGFTPQTKGVQSYSCWMGMIYGDIIVK